MKEPTKQEHIDFFQLLLEGATPKAASEELGYVAGTGYGLMKTYKEYFLDLIQAKLVLHGAQAADVVINGMSSDGKIVNEKIHITTAQDVLDRIGVAKQNRLDVSVTEGAGIVILPAKDDEDNPK